jgi:hypothetical protein
MFAPPPDDPGVGQNVDESLLEMVSRTPAVN